MATGRVPTTANSPLTAKGDLFGYSTTQARVAVGNDGETLVADSSTSTGLRYTENYAAGKNKIINGDYFVNQRGFTTSTSAGYFLDRWYGNLNTGTVTYSASTFTPGAAPVAGYEGKNFLTVATSGQSAAGAFTFFLQKMEDVRTFANQTVTISFWAKAASGTPKVAVEFQQDFGSGGSPSAGVNTYINNTAITTSWARYTITGTIPSISGKTIGTTANTSFLQLNFWVSAGSTFDSRTGSIGVQNNTIDMWGVQVEDGSVATAFNTATGTIQGELAACQRYYYRYQSDATTRVMAFGQAISATQALYSVTYPVTLRTRPSALEQSGTAANYRSVNSTAGQNDLTAVPAFDGATSNTIAFILATTIGLVAGNATYLFSGSTSAYLGWSAEL